MATRHNGRAEARVADACNELEQLANFIRSSEMRAVSRTIFQAVAHEHLAYGLTGGILADPDPHLQFPLVDIERHGCRASQQEPERVESGAALKPQWRDLQSDWAGQYSNDDYVRRLN